MSFIETKYDLPFEDKAYKKYIPLYIKIVNPRNKEELDILNNKDICEKNYETYIDYINNTEFVEQNLTKEHFYNLLIKICDLSKGTYKLIPFMIQEELTNYIKEKYNKNYFRSYNKQPNIYKYSTEIIKDILVFRFFIFKPSYFKENETQGFYETFRICFKGLDSWVEDRNKCVHFDLNYQVGTKNIYKYTKYTNITISKSKRDIYTIYPFMKDLGFEITHFCFFCKKFYDLYKNNRIYKNVPINIKEDLNNKNILNDTEKELMQDKRYCFKFRVNSKFSVFHIYYNRCEIERLYFDKNKLYKFGYNFFENNWTSTKKEKLFALNIKTCISPNMYQLLEKDDTILSRYKYYEKFTIQFYLLQMKYLFLEQLIKIGFDISDYYHNLEYKILSLNETLKLNLSKKEFQELNLSQLLNIPSSKFKMIDKNKLTSFSFLENMKKRYHNKFFIENFPNDDFRLQISQLIIDDTKLRKIIKLFNKNNKEVHCFFKAILKKDVPERYLLRYIDYLKFLPLANKYGAFVYQTIIKPSEIDFLHNKAYRDYSYQKEKESNKENLESRFYKFCQSEEYQQFFYSDSEYSIIGAKNSFELFDEGKALSHCVGSYRNAMSKQKSYIYFLRENKNLEKPFQTIEIKKYKQNKNYIYKLNQCYGKNDSIKKSKSCKKFIKEWCKNKNIEISCIL